MGKRTESTITGTAAGVPFTALAPATDGPAPLIVTWHLLDAPCTDAAFAAAVPMSAVDAWRVHLGMPLCGARAWENGLDKIINLAKKDAMLAYLEPIIGQAVREFPAALAELRDRFATDGGPIGLVGGSAGGMVALRVLADGKVPVAAAAVVNAAIRARTVVELVGEGFGFDYTWTPEAAQAARRLDFVARADDLAASGAPLLLVSGELDYPGFRADAIALADTLDQATLTSVPDLAHPIAELPGIEPAPQTPTAKIVDAAMTDWFRLHLTGQGVQ